MSNGDSDIETYDLADPGDDRAGLEDEIDEVDGDDGDDEDEFDDLDDATEEDVDFIVALYREDGAQVAEDLSYDLANDLEDVIAELRRFPGDAGSLGVCSIAGEFFVLVRVRGQVVQVVLSDAVAAGDWPLARDAADFLDEEIPDEDDSAPVGDLDMLVDLGCSEFELEQLCLNYEDSSDEVAIEVVEKIQFGDVLREVLD